MNPPESAPPKLIASRISDKGMLAFRIKVDTYYMRFLRSLVNETEIRIVVGTAGGTGHQSSAIVMLKLITQAWSTADPGNERNKTVYLIYQIPGNLQPLYKTEPSLQGDNIVFNGIKVVLQERLGITSSTYNYGFAGAFDDPGNLAKKFKVKYFLRLQPLYWRHMDEIHYNDWGIREDDITTNLINYEYVQMVGAKREALPRLSMLYPIPDFRCLGYYYQLPALPNWASLNTPVINTIRQVIQNAERGDYELCVTYSIGKGTVYTNKTSEIIFNLVSGFAFAKMVKSITKNHVIILNFTTDLDSDEVKKANLMLLSPQNRAQELDRLTGNNSEKIKLEILKAEANLEGFEIYNHFKQAKLVFHSLDISDNLDAILGDNTNFHVILLTIPSRQPKEVFDYCLSKVTLFSAFEGSGTASIAATIGKPYLKFNLLFPDAAAQYLFYPNGHEVMSLDAANFCQMVANSLAFSFSDWKKNKDTPYLCPFFTIEHFIALYRAGDKELEQYFNACRNFYQQEKNTRVYVALGVFYMMIINKSQRKNNQSE